MSPGSPRTDTAQDPALSPGGTVVIFGGRSEIGMAVATRLAPGRVVVLAARRSHELASETSLLLSGGATAVHTAEFDALHHHEHAGVVEAISAEHGRVAVIVIAFGVLGDQDRAEHDPLHAVEIVTTDFVSHVSVLTSAASALRAQGSGSLVVFSSVAGIRVRRANYVYGSAKAGLDGFACGLSDALYGSGVRLLLVRPGFVKGKMTEGMTPAPFSSTPGTVADAVVRALQGGAERVWVPRVLGPVFFLMRFVPRSLWRRLPR